MRERDEIPAFIGLGRQARHEGKQHRHGENAGDRVHHRLCRFLRAQAGRHWADVLPEIDARLRTCGLARAHAVEVRRRLIESLTTDWRGVRSDGGTLEVEDGWLRFRPMNRKQRRRVVALSAAELRTQPELIR